ncbi:segregation and condensation protein B [Gottschalkia acidurici 9a]|uniref:Segregation and condensation protein B n=1 Tax=Gottschalkia acidurici (strain ATCC 7906 / DSM 604 / BCRC 14475 / CIP 104303 / KCTC 5404 / NCIMB 10678 / 9a) TaxID=1128398 RepID=K0B1A8_GOTA9|nr:SMC-Scp complex subunit ScpB [Gottschalkia acidurici]AFS78421.1 segregation and condensation protein B [Gottschalkia acidurici 9a]
MDKREIKSVIEGLLFTWGDPLSIKDIRDVLEIPEKEVNDILHEMIDEFNYERRGIQILKTNNTYQLGTRAEHFEWMKKLCVPKESKTLSAAALETLSIIAYKQPIIKSEIEAIRGVKCDKAISTLLEKKLIKEAGRLEKTGRPILYGTTDEFLKCFGLDTLKQLPQLKEIIEDKEEKNI